MCLFSIFVFVTNLCDLFMNQKISELVTAILHVMQVITVIFFLIKHKISFRDIKLFTNKFSFKIAFISAFISIMLLFMNLLCEKLISLPETSSAESSFYATLFMVIFAGFFAPIVEEIEFRGLLFKTQQRSYPMIFAVLMSSIMFFILHTGYFNWGALGLGIISSLMLLWTNNLIYSIIIHFTNNIIIAGLGILAFFIPENSDTETVNEEISLNANTLSATDIIETLILLICVIAFLIFLMSIVYKLTRKQQTNNNKENEIQIPKNKKSIGYYLFYFIVCISSTIMQVVLKK